MNKHRFVPLIVLAFIFTMGLAILSTGAFAPARSAPAAPDAARLVGQVILPYPNEVEHTVYIEDVSPDAGSSAQDETTSHYASRWGIMNALSVSHPQSAISPACNYASDNAGVLVEHVAAVDPDGHLISFYYSSDNDWKAVNIAEKTGIVVETEQPTCWTVDADGVLLENIAARRSSGHVYAFTWHANSDWQATNLSSMLGYWAVSPTTSWNAPAGPTTAEHVAFRTQDSDLVLFWRLAGQTWGAVNVSTSNTTGVKKVAGTPTGWYMSSGGNNLERLAVTDSNQHLILFTYSPATTNWTYQDVSAALSNQLVEGRVTAWDHNGVQYIAAHTPEDHLIVLWYDPIDSLWLMEDITPSGVGIINEPVSWMTQPGGQDTFHIVAPDDAGHIRHFYKLATAGSWSVEDITTVTGETSYLPQTAWSNTGASGLVQRLAAPDLSGFLHVHTLPAVGNWSADDVSERSAGRIVYAGAPFAGVWISRDYGVTWYQSTQTQPGVDESEVPNALDSNLILDLIVSPSDYNRVIALADLENRTNAASGAGIYVSEGGGDYWDLKYQFNCPWGVEGPSQVVVAPDDPGRFYVAGGCGIARSTDFGINWTRIMTVANDNQRVWHLDVSGQTGATATDRTIVACGSGNLWASKNGGQNWYLDGGTAQGLPSGFCGKTAWGHYNAAHLLALRPDDPTIVYMAFANEANGPSYYHPTSLGEGPEGTFCNNPVVYDADNDNQYDAGETKIWGTKPVATSALADHANLKFRDLDNDGQLDSDEAVVNDADNDDTYDKGEIVLRKGTTLNVNDPLNDDSLIKYVNLGRPFGTRGCGEGSVWKGDLSDVLNQQNLNQGAWSQLPGPPVYWGAGTGSGAVYVYTHPTETGFLTFFADQDTVHVAVGEPTTTGWHRLDGSDASSVHRSGGNSSTQYMHVDPEGFAVSPDFNLTLKAVSDQPFPYNQNSELDTCGGGRLWIAHDGGVSRSDNCGATDERWRDPESGLNTLPALNIQGATSLDLTPALYFGTADNDDFYSMDAGDTWNTAKGYTCGDCDTWFGDLYQVERILRLQPRANSGKGAFDLFTNPSMDRPNAGQTSQLKTVNYPDGVRPYAVSHLVILGYRAAVQTVPTGTPPPDGDYVAIEAAGSNEHHMRRAEDQLSSTGMDRYGPQIPTLPAASVPPQRNLWVQPSGGHDRPVFYLGDGTHLWRGEDPITSWEQVVPTGTLTAAWRFFVNPYDASMIYLLSPQGVYSSTNSGQSWQQANELQRALTANGDWQLGCWSANCPINDMVFDPTHPNRRFAAGLAGVFFTADGAHWFRLLDTRAMPSRPRGMWFDPLSDPNDDTLYVAMDGRGILRLHPIPTTSPVLPPTPPPPLPTPTPTPTPAPPGTGENILNNGGFFGGLGGWTIGGATSYSESLAHNENGSARLGHEDTPQDELYQTVELPCDAEGLFLSYYTYISSTDNHPSMDHFSASVEMGDESVTLQTLTEESPQGAWYPAVFDLSGYRCQPLTVRFASTQNSQLVTAFFVDDVKLLYYNGTYYTDLPLMIKE